MPKTILVQARSGGEWKEVQRVQDNRRRLIHLPLLGEFDALRVTMEEAWGGGSAGFFALEVGAPDYAAAVSRVAWPDIVFTGGDGTA